mmetsp:Transcript_15070/g.38355  ORF Transcript_15070/g.38355 Transcript_15070/m.38355 type:complete len:228 (+) Transcript_15070:957-1640(+)
MLYPLLLRSRCPMSRKKEELASPSSFPSSWYIWSLPPPSIEKLAAIEVPAISLSLTVSSSVLFLAFSRTASMSISPSPSASPMRITVSAPKRIISRSSSLLAALCLSTRRPCCTTMASRKSFLKARSSTFSSMLFSVTKRYTVTGLVCPMRCARSMAWMSTCGFQSESKRTTMLAFWRLRPSPPARVESRKRNLSESGAMKLSIISSRTSPAMPPSMRQYLCPLYQQ